MKQDCPPLSNSSTTVDYRIDELKVPRGVGVELFHSTDDPLLVVTPQGKIVEVNSALLKAAEKKQSEVIGKGICEIIHGGRWPHIECPLEEFLLTNSPSVENTKLPGLNGEYSLTIVPVTASSEREELILLIARKLTLKEIRNIDTIRTAQLAALGELAAGVAHEVNNPINGIINFAQLLLDDCQKNTEHSFILKKIVEEGERIAGITYNLLSFARENENDQIIVDLNEVVLDSLSLVQHQLKNDGIQIKSDLFQPSCLVMGNHLHLMQVILNLISNSRFALNERSREDASPKSIHVSCFPVAIDERRYFRIIVRDNGTGIPQGILEKLFDPFFTSKPAGQGSGLGLSISYGIVKYHNGIFRVDSILNQYTDMIIEIPASEM